MRSILLFLALGGCVPAALHPAADPDHAVAPLRYRPLAETAPALVDAPPLDWRAANDEMLVPGGTGGDAGHAGHKH